MDMPTGAWGTWEAAGLCHPGIFSTFPWRFQPNLFWSVTSDCINVNGWPRALLVENKNWCALGGDWGAGHRVLHMQPRQEAYLTTCHRLDHKKGWAILITSHSPPSMGHQGETSGHSPFTSLTSLAILPAGPSLPPGLSFELLQHQFLSHGRAFVNFVPLAWKALPSNPCKTVSYSSRLSLNVPSFQEPSLTISSRYPPLLHPSPFSLVFVTIWN